MQERLDLVATMAAVERKEAGAFVLLYAAEAAGRRFAFLRGLWPMVRWDVKACERSVKAMSLPARWNRRTPPNTWKESVPSFMRSCIDIQLIPDAKLPGAMTASNLRSPRAPHAQLSIRHPGPFSDLSPPGWKVTKRCPFDLLLHKHHPSIPLLQEAHEQRSPSSGTPRCHRIRSQLRRRLLVGRKDSDPRRLDERDVSSISVTLQPQLNTLLEVTGVRLKENSNGYSGVAERQLVRTVSAACREKVSRQVLWYIAVM